MGNLPLYASRINFLVLTSALNYVAALERRDYPDLAAVMPELPEVDVAHTASALNGGE